MIWKGSHNPILRGTYNHHGKNTTKNAQSFEQEMPTRWAPQKAVINNEGDISLQWNPLNFGHG